MIRAIKKAMLPYGALATLFLITDVLNTNADWFCEGVLVTLAFVVLVEENIKAWERKLRRR